MISRRRYMGGGGYENNLLYYWDSRDTLVNGTKWVDRVQGCVWEHDTSTSLNYSSDGGIIVGKNQAIFTMNGQASDFNLPDHWIIEVSFDKTGGYTNNVYLIDFGSVTSANNAFCLGFSYQFTDNLKTEGNKITYIFNSASASVDPDFYIPVGKHVIRYGCEQYDVDTDRRYISEGDNITYGPVTPKLSYRSDTWHRNTFFIGKGNALESKDAMSLYYIKIYSI